MRERVPPRSHAPAAAPPVVGAQADGLREFRRLLASATVRRWPMYLRNVQQLLRDATPPFDGRAYGFGTLVDLLRAAHRDGIVRVDRDRQGVIRVFEGAVGSPEAASATVTTIDPQAEPQAQSGPVDAATEAPYEDTGGVAEDAEDNIGNVAPSEPAPAAGRPSRRRRGGAPRAPSTTRKRAARK
jgi:hypothetical protein